MRRFDVITFDCYGTLIDWEQGLVSAFQRMALRRGIALDGQRMLTVYHQVEPIVEADSFRTYREVLRETSRRVLRTFGWEPEESELDFLPESVRDWKPFPDTNQALVDLRSLGYALGILSNVDDDLFEETRRQLSVDFEFIITAQQIRSYKPKLGHFVEARERVGSRKWIHAAQSYFHDVLPSSALGIPVAWINRKSAPPEAETRPDFEYHNLQEFAEAMSKTS